MSEAQAAPAVARVEELRETYAFTLPSGRTARLHKLWLPDVTAAMGHLEGYLEAMTIAMGADPTLDDVRVRMPEILATALSTALGAERIGAFFGFFGLEGLPQEFEDFVALWEEVWGHNQVPFGRKLRDMASDGRFAQARAAWVLMMEAMETEETASLSPSSSARDTVAASC